MLFSNFKRMQKFPTSNSVSNQNLINTSSCRAQNNKGFQNELPTNPQFG